MHALEKEMAAHSSVLAWRIPGTEEPGGLLSMGSHRVGHDWGDLAAAAAAPSQYGILLYHESTLHAPPAGLAVFGCRISFPPGSSLFCQWLLAASNFGVLGRVGELKSF